MRAKHFDIHELVPEHIFEKFGISAWRFIDSKLVETLDTIKEYFPEGTMTINNYYWGGDRLWSGLRTPESPWYSETSMHSLGHAIDAVFSAYEVETVRQFILLHPNLFPHVKGIELEVSWLHVDTRNTVKLVTFKQGA